MDQVEVSDIQLPWTAYPNTKLNSIIAAIPPGFIYTPLKPFQNLPQVDYPPVLCHNCSSILNKFCQIDFTRKTFICSICRNENPLPLSYHQITPDLLPLESYQQTIEYSLPKVADIPPVFLFVVDTCLSENQLSSLKSLLFQIQTSLPQKALVGFINFDNLVYINDMKFSEIAQSFVFNGLKVYDAPSLNSYLQNSSTFLPLSEAEQMLISLIDNLAPDSTSVPKGKRANRCTGTALSIAVFSSSIKISLNWRNNFPFSRWSNH